MIPQLTEAWGATYLHVLIILLVFALGFPELIYELTIPDQVKEIARRQVSIGWLLSLVVFILAAAMLFIWYFHPCDGTEFSKSEEIATGLIMSLALGSAVAYSFWRFRFYSRSIIVQNIQQKTLNNLLQGRQISDQDLSDLSTLGELAKPGREKARVIQALVSIATSLMNSVDYSGDKIGSIIEGIGAISTNADNSGDDDNFLLTGESLVYIRGRLTDLNLLVSNDFMKMENVFNSLASIVAEQKSESTGMKYLGYNSLSASFLFNIALSSIQKGTGLIAGGALMKLEALVEKEKTLIAGENLNILLGLLAEFYYGGPSMRQRSESFFHRLKDSFSPSLIACLEAAYIHHYEEPNYSTADKLHAMMREYLDGKLVF
jgi:hypothetical protein